MSQQAQPGGVQNDDAAISVNSRGTIGPQLTNILGFQSELTPTCRMAASCCGVSWIACRTDSTRCLVPSSSFTFCWAPDRLLPARQPLLQLIIL